MYFYILFYLIHISLSIELYIEKEKEYLILNDEGVAVNFAEESIQQSQCHPSKLYIENQDEKYSKFIFKNDEQQTIIVSSQTIIYNTDVLDISYSYQQKSIEIKPNQQDQFIVNYQCKFTPDEVSWSLIIFQFTIGTSEIKNQTYQIQYFKQCKQSDFFIHPLILLLIFASSIIVIGSNYGLIELKILETLKTEEFTTKTSVLFILTASLLLVSLYEFPIFGQIILSIFIAILGIISIKIISQDILEKCINNNKLSNILSYIISILLVLTYFYTKHWLVNNLIAFIVVLTMFKTIEIDSFKTATLLLSLAFLYDIFWVFISPYIFGKSVMATVATQIDLPMKFICPSFIQSLNNPLTKCSLLGLGDILLPGVVIKYVLKYEVMANKGYGLYITSIIGYIFGLTICIISLVIFQSAQPALLYIVPLILIPTLILSVKKKQFSQLWNGQITKIHKSTGVYELQQSEQI